MPISINDIPQLFRHGWKQPLQWEDSEADAAPLRSELFSAEQLQRHAQELAGWHELSHQPDEYALLRRLADNAAALERTHDMVSAGVAARHRITSAAEWLLDNYYLIGEQIRTSHRHLPRGYSRRLPRLANGPHRGLPRVYAISIELISHTDGRVDIENINGFTASYQTLATLTLGELWAIPIMLRLALIENLRRVAVRICDRQQECRIAGEWFGRMVAQSPSGLITAVADMAREDRTLSPAFVAEYARLIQGQSTSLSFATGWIEQRLAERHLTMDQLVLAENQSQAADQVSIGNSITSMRTLAAIDWRQFVEGASAVEAILRRDPASVYAGMDFATRDRYRHAVEALSRRSRSSETQVANQAIALATAGAQPGAPQRYGADDRRAGHVGYYLTDEGRIDLARRVGARPTLGMLMARCRQWLHLVLYVVPVAVAAGFGVAVAVAAVLASGWHATDRWLPLWLTLLGLAVACAISQTALSCVNFLVTRLLRPETLPRLDFKDGIPVACSTLIVIPSMIGRRQDVDELIDGLEVRYLANPDANLYFALLTDYPDAHLESLSGDEALLQYASAAIAALNEKYQAHRQGIFHLLHRPRRWNDRERVWMGEERKRGKLADLNRLLREGDRRPFQRIVGDAASLAGIAYVITLDTDSHLPREAAHKLIGTMAHPLNRAILDPRERRVVAGYGVLQPRPAISLVSTSRSYYARLFAGDSGIDPYTRAVSDVYQDAFQEGSFIGKGIYDLHAFETATGGRFPDNTILSHDLIEGCYARSGLVSDVLVIEDQPSRYLADVARRHRWIRGDWQILWWLLPRVPTKATASARKRWVRNPLPALARWKIFDNIRRSLAPLALILLLLAGWTVLPGLPWAWTLMVLGLLAAPVLIQGFVGLLSRQAEVPLGMHLHSWASGFMRDVSLVGCSLVLLPHQAQVTIDAAGRSLWRILVSRRLLLAWQTSDAAERAVRADILGIYVTMWSAPLLAVAVAVAVLRWYPEATTAALPFAVLWLLAPTLAWWLSRTRLAPPPRLTADDHIFLRSLSRRTWRFFETFVNTEDNWLPPDNYQEYAIAAAAHRTSPTNIGMALLSNLVAFDFAYLTAGQFLERCERTIATLLSMERHRGHFFNWYDTRTLQPLLPRYISTVDSGNLSGHLVVLRSGLVELPLLPLQPAGLLMGIRHTVLCLTTANGEASSLAAGRPRQPELEAKLLQLSGELASQPSNLTTTFAQLGRVLILAEAVAQLAQARGEELDWWSTAVVRECRTRREELTMLVPWVAMQLAPLTLWRGGTTEQQRQCDDVRVLVARLDHGATLDDIAGFTRSIVPVLDEIAVGLEAKTSVAAVGFRDWLADFRRRLEVAAEAAGVLIAQSDRLAEACGELADAQFAFLYDRTRELFAIGFNVSDNRLDRSYYDLLASEARLSSFLAIAQGQIEQDHWFSLGRQLTIAGDSTALLSWSGSMFEYLMPNLVMPSYVGSLLDVTNHAVVRRQIEYGRQRGVPWGISESGYNHTDAQLSYLYRAFGVPGLGFKRGLAEDLVIAPYASAMALMVEPEAACANLRRLAAEGHQGAYGMYEAIDFTPARLPEGSTAQRVQSYMAHHQGMALLGFAHLLLNQPMQRRFVADPQFKATLLLLQERVLRTVVVVQPHPAEAGTTVHVSNENESVMRVFTNPNGPIPEVHLLSNGRYHVTIGTAGGGYSRWKDLAVNRWREDPTREAFGMFCYLRDMDRGEVWSNTHQPTLRPCKSYEAIFTQARAEFRRRDHDIDVHTQVSVSPEDDIELRRITLINRSNEVRVIELTSYAEVVVAPQAGDVAHPAFSNLFVQTSIDHAHRAILCTRRARGPEERPPWVFHLMTLSATEVGEATYETDRMRFIGRGRTVASPAALMPSGRLSGSEGSVLDPVASIRRCVQLQPEEEVDIDLVFGMADSRQSAEALIAKYHDQRLCERVFGLSWTHSQVVLRQLGASEADAQLYGRLAGSVIYPHASRRASAALLARNRRSQAGLWAYGISGDLPIVLLRVSDSARLDLTRELIRAHVYWRTKGLSVDLVIWNEDYSVYRQTLHEQITGMVASASETVQMDRPGGIFVRRAEQMSEEDRILLQTVARIVISDGDGTLAQFAERRPRSEGVLPRLVPNRQARRLPPPIQEYHPDLVLNNGIGGFTPDGREYIMTLEEGVTTPLPWVNVLANPDFGTVISESGGAYTWAGNSHEYRLTTWHNDPVSDSSGEAFYLRDEDSGRFWSPSPGPARGVGRYVVRHGFGYSAFLHEEEGLACEMMVFIAVDAPVKVISITVTNRSQRRRRLSLTGYWEWVLGEQRQQSGLHVVTELDHVSGVLTARNPYHAEAGSRIAFVDVNHRSRTVTGDRAEFLGRNGSFASPAAMYRQRLSGRVGAGLDPCAALQVPFDLADDEVREIIFVIGAGEGIEQVRQLATRHCAVEGARRTLEQVWAHWNRTLDALHVETPDPAVNILANGWLVYQTIACRMWARSGFYQSGGAFGFRDQLQDAMALVHVAPWLLREHILRAAAHQFREGDVQHWWHPPSGRGVRTHFSDDYLWLPYAVARYCLATGDNGILDEVVPFLEGRALDVNEEAYYDKPVPGLNGTVYEHCTRAILHGLRWGTHGLPLMGCGDWNDGMNQVGAAGKGESVWLAFFLHDVLRQFGRVALLRSDVDFAERCTQEALDLQVRIEANAWDGGWYRRAYFDNGVPLGSASNPECQIDSLPQSWAVLSGVADPARARAAMDAVEHRLVDRSDRLIRLFTPPFDRSDLNPGYIKGYVPGVRENGGQYTHAAVWTIMAFAQLGDVDRAWELWSLINPVDNTSTPQAQALYKAEPYVVAADVYGLAPHTGRGGWTWYTGSAGWMYRLLTESFLGFRLESGHLHIEPKLPAAWSGFTARYRHRDTYYHIRVERTGRVAQRLILDGATLTDSRLPLIDDRGNHEIRVEM